MDRNGNLLDSFTLSVQENTTNKNASLENATDITNFYPLGNPTFDSRLLSYFGRLFYNYKEKYLFLDFLILRTIIAQ